MSSPLVLHLIFCQIVGDMFNKFHSVHARISADEREEMLDVRILHFRVTYYYNYVECEKSVLSLIRKI